MAIFNQQNAQCLVFTYKEGLLSKVAHDLKLAVTRFEITVDDAQRSVQASFDTSSLRVVNAMRGGTEHPSALRAGDKQKIAATIREDVLHAERFPTATFQSKSVVSRPDGGHDLEGELRLHGATKQVMASTRLEDGQQVLEMRIHQPDFGITPYRAMMGTLKVRPDVLVQLRV